MKKLSVKQRFYKFLKDEGIWNLFWYNVRLYDKEHDIKEIRQINDVKQYIDDAFHWMTSEIFLNEDVDKKYDFWENIDMKWMEILSTENYI